LLKSLPNIRTALFSRLGPGTKLSYHTGTTITVTVTVNITITITITITINIIIFIIIFTNNTNIGWADLANYVLRCHINIKVPDPADGLCGLCVNEKIEHHHQGMYIVIVIISIITIIIIITTTTIIIIIIIIIFGLLF
jgi:hypothetical protein